MSGFIRYHKINSRVDHNDIMLLRLFGFFAKYDQIDGDIIASVYISCNNNYETAKNSIISIYKLSIPVNENPEAIDLEEIPEVANNDEDSDSDSEYSIPEGAEIIEPDNYDPELVILGNVKVKEEQIEENKKRPRPIEFDLEILEEPVQKKKCHIFCDEYYHYIECPCHNPFLSINK